MVAKRGQLGVKDELKSQLLRWTVKNV